MRPAAARVLCALIAAGGAACGGDSEGPAAEPRPPLPWAASVVPASPEPADNPTTPEKAELGRLLFYDPILSTDLAVACVTCHSEIWGMSDGLPVSVGVGGEGPVGPGRTGLQVTRRNAPTLWNSAHLKRLFADGRAGSLEEQVLGPLEEPAELGRDPDAVVADLRGIPEYEALFVSAFPESQPAVTTENLTRAIAAFERTLVTNRAPYDQYVAGDEGALSDAAKRGMFAFEAKGCATCHVPPLFDSDTFANRGVAPIPEVEDHGRREVTKDPADEGAFRVPTLRNIRETSPYFHTGAVETLEEAVRHEVALDAPSATENEISDIVTFLHKGLIDPSRSPRRPDTVPSGLTVPVDGFRVPR